MVDIRPQIAISKQWRYIWIRMHSNAHSSTSLCASGTFKLQDTLHHYVEAGMVQLHKQNSNITIYYNKEIEQHRNQEMQHYNEMTETGYVELYKYCTKFLQERENTTLL
jgi:hypothetical protein